MGKKKQRKENCAGKAPEASSEQPKESKPPSRHQNNGRGGNRGRRTFNARVSTTLVDSERSEEKVTSTDDSDVQLCPNVPVSTFTRIRSASECPMVVTPCPPEVLKAKQMNISADNDPILSSRRAVNYFEMPRERIRRDSSDSRMPVRDIHEPVPSSKARRSLPSTTNGDMNRKSSIPRSYAPMSVKALLARVEEIDSPVKEENEYYLEFTGGTKLQLHEKRNCLDIFLEEAALEGESRRELTWMIDGLIQMINPISRQTDELLTLDESFEAVVEFTHSVEDSDRKAVIAEMEPAVVKETVLWVRRLFFVHCCSTGFVAQDFIDDKAPFFEKISKLNHKSELDLLLRFADRLSHSVIVIHGNELVGTVEEIKDLLELLENENIDELAKKNVIYSLNDPVDRLRFNRPITDDELFKIVDNSVTTDCGKYLWIIDRCPEKLKGSARIVASIVKGISLKRVSKDQRPSRAYYMFVPQLVASLTDEELYSLAEEHVDKRERKVDNWPEMMYEGYLMSLTNIKQKPKDNTDVVLLKLLEVDAVEDMKHFLYACALIAEFNPDLCPRVYDFSKDSFCTRMARVFMSSQISPAKRSLLLESLMSLPEPFKDRLLAREGFNPEHSLYHTVKAICTEMPKVPTADIRKWGQLVVRELATVLSPARMISFAILPCLTNGSTRLRAASLLPELLISEKLPKELLEEQGDLSPAHLVKIALEQYEEPEGDAPKPRYGFIESILKMVDGVLEGDVPPRMIDGIDAVFEEKGLTWQQHYALLHINFPKSNGKLKAPKIPPVVFTLEGLANFNLASLLQTWPNREDVRLVFEKAASDLFANEDRVLIAYALLSAATGSHSKIKDHFDFLKELVGKTKEVTEVYGELGGNDDRELGTVEEESSKREESNKDEIVEETLEEDGKPKKNSEDGETEESSSGSDNNEKVGKLDDIEVDVTQEECENETEANTWLTQMLLEASDVDPGLRRAVLRIAVSSAKYTREATRIQLAVSVAKNSPMKNNMPLESPVVWDEGEAIDEKPFFVERVPDVVQNVSVAEDDAEAVLPPETPAPPATPASSCATVVGSTQSTPAPSMIAHIDRIGNICPIIYQKRANEGEFSRWVIWFNTDLTTSCGDIIGFLKGPHLRNKLNLPHFVHLSVGGRRPDIPQNKNRGLLPNDQFPLHMELVCPGQNGEQILNQITASLAIELCNYVERCYRSPSHYNGGKGQQVPSGGQGRSDQQFRRQEETGGHMDWVTEMVTLNGVGSEVFEDKLGNYETFYELKKNLKCRLRTVNRASQNLQEDPYTVEIKGCAEAVQNAVSHIKNLFNLA